ncbi:MAG: hypothetical protein ACOYJ8_03840 [Patescibacteria group bacterium]
MSRLRLSWPKGLALLLLLVAFVFVHRFFFSSGSFSTHDGVHFIRLYNLEKVLNEGQFPPRWLPDLGKGYGYPFFNFYPPLAYLVGLLFRFFGTSFTLAVNLSFVLAGLLGFLGMFFLAKSLFGFWGAVTAALFWLFLPYRALDLYVRGSLAEYWGMNLLPLVFYLAKRLFDLPTLKRLFPFVLGLFLLLIAHNGVALVGLFWLFIFVLFLFVIDRQSFFEKIRHQGIFFFSSFLLAFGLAAFFILPAILEKDLTQIAQMTSDYYSYENHFPSLRQLFISRFWDYGGSVLGPEDKMSFQIGHLHWLTALVALFFLIKKVVFEQKKFWSERKNFWLMFFLISFWGFAFLAHQRSNLFWRIFPFLAFLQFPWRLLIFVGFSASVLAGFWAKWAKKRLWFVFIFLALLILNFTYFRPQDFQNFEDEDYLSSPLWKYQQREFLTDYLPKTVEEVPQDHFENPLLVTGAETNINLNQADKLIFGVVSGGEEEVIIKRFYFPGWQAKIDNKPTSITTNKNGFMVLSLPEGESLVEVVFKNTPTRTIANQISLFSWGVFLFFILMGNRIAKYFKKNND